ncbi:Acetyltransferases [Nocardioides sp. J9]|uniref:GNAT family N-acetyltransferase n=1 Tax=Nocardioides sp. J9 TaxID=935844 RepID=UPI0011ACA6C5|nr:GNAT family N-acetyltransferase [Nocardioides sp. J9]TWG93455.1 Acetyltransferases [Nocardioides sp. J9]
MRLGAATEGDVDDVAGILADAFADYPWTRWTVDGDRHVQRLEAIQRLCVAELALPYGEVTVAEDAGSVCGVAIWLDATAVPGHVWERVGPALTELLGSRAAAAARADDLLGPLRPDGPHLTLESLGVAGSHQRRGIGGALVTHGLRTADARSVPVRLETSTADNVRLYERLGFVTTDEVTLPEGGPTVWLMSRAPQPVPSDQ